MVGSERVPIVSVAPGVGSLLSARERTNMNAVGSAQQRVAKPMGVRTPAETPALPGELPRDWQIWRATSIISSANGKWKEPCRRLPLSFAIRHRCPRRWPSVYLAVTELQPSLENGTGKVVRLLTRRWLPYFLDGTPRVTESRQPHGLTLEAEGDFNGRGIWKFDQDGPGVLIRDDWKI